MEYYPWWNEAQKELADDAKKFTDEVLIPLAERACWERRFPWDGLKEITKKGWNGALIPKKYGGMMEDWGATGAVIILEELGRAGSLCHPFANIMHGATTQIVHDGNEAQKQMWLPKIASGKLLCCITMTEPYAGSDIAGIETSAVRDGDYYIVNGKKRFQTASAAADLYMAYVKTSDDPEDVRSHNHLTGLIIEKGMPGFTIEKVNDLLAMDGVYNCYMDFENVRVPVANRIGDENMGWQVMMRGLNVERVFSTAPLLGSMRESLRYAQQHLERRVQFRAPTGSIVTNQFKIADIIVSLSIARLIVYYAAYRADLGNDIPVEAASARLFATKANLEGAIEAIQLMGGNGVTKYYPVERLFREAKLAQIAAGTEEVLRLVTYRMGTRALTEELKVPYRAIDERLGVPMPVGKPPTPKKAAGDNDVLAVLAEDYRVNPGLHMTLGDIRERLDISDKDLNGYLLSLEEKGLVALYRDRKGVVTLAKATFAGMAKAFPKEHYRYIPSWVDKNDIF